mgnify:CR=1 FL=1
MQNRNPDSNLDPKLHRKQFTPKLNGLEINPQSSPSRILSDLFWKELPWNRIVDELGSLFAFDTGCGSGRYGSYLNVVSQGCVTQYKGVDIYEHPNWKKLRTDPKRTVEKYDGKNITSSLPPETNFFMSQSAIEHFANDLHYFEEINQFVQTHSQPIIQVHLFPSVACMKLYGRHGYRQYTPRTISKITRLFPTSQCFLFGLGGPACNEVHDAYMTKPLATEGVDYRKTKPEEYQQQVLNAIQADKNIAPTDPSFWALVICSNWKKPFVV